VPPLLIAVVIAELTLDLVALTVAIARGSHVALPGALLRTIVMGCLGILTLRKRRRWARIVFVAVEYCTAAAALLLTFVVPGGGVRFEPGVLAISLVFLVAAVAASIGKVEAA
jgi:hypothetical protein